MITVNICKYSQTKTTWLIQELIDIQHCGNRAVFVGNVGHYLHKLFLVTHECIVLVEDPQCTWSDGNIEVQINFWCDLEINAKRL